jgi:hypothetical protein
MTCYTYKQIQSYRLYKHENKHIELMKRKTNKKISFGAVETKLLNG